MGITKITAECRDQVLRLNLKPKIASGGVNEDRIEFTFCELWADFEKTAVFYRNKNAVYHVPLEDSCCFIPAQVLATAGTLYIGVFGERADGTTRTSNIVQYRIEQGAITEQVIPEPEPDVYAELLATMGNLEDLETNDRSSLVAAINEVRRTGGGTGGTSFRTDDTLTLKNGILSVNTAKEVEEDNTLPITSAAVHTTVGNIEILLSTI